MVILALERFISITWPLRKNMLSTRKQAKRTLFILVLVIALWCTFKFETAGVEEYSTFKVINFDSDQNAEVMTSFDADTDGMTTSGGGEQDDGMCQRKLTLTTMVNISTVFWAIVPEFLTLLLNLFIIHRIRITTNLNGKFYSSERTRKITQATRVVLFLSIIFVLLISPTGILIIIEFVTKPTKPDLEALEHEFNLMVARKVVLMFYETNMVIHFPIYMLTIKNFK